MKFLKKIFFAALLLVDARIVGQIVGHRLVAVPQVARAEGRVHHLHRRDVAALRRPVLGRQRQRILDVGHVLLKTASFRLSGSLRIRMAAAVGRLHAQQIVEVGLVGREDDVELGILQIEPGEIALDSSRRSAGRRRAGAERWRTPDRRSARRRRAASWPRPRGIEAKAT